MDINTSTFVFNDIIILLSNPFLDSDSVVQIFKSLYVDLKNEYESNTEIIFGVKYYYDLLQELLICDEFFEEDFIEHLAIVFHKYLMHAHSSLYPTNSSYTLIQTMMKAVVHQFWQRIFSFFHHPAIMHTNDDIHESQLLLQEYIIDTIRDLNNLPSNK